MPPCRRCFRRRSRRGRAHSRRRRASRAADASSGRSSAGPAASRRDDAASRRVPRGPAPRSSCSSSVSAWSSAWCASATTSASAASERRVARGARGGFEALPAACARRRTRCDRQRHAARRACVGAELGPAVGVAATSRDATCSADKLSAKRGGQRAQRVEQHHRIACRRTARPRRADPARVRRDAAQRGIDRDDRGASRGPTELRAGRLSGRRRAQSRPCA